MNKQKWSVLAVTLGLVAISAAFLTRLRSLQRLGEPGLRLSPVPMLSDRGNPVGTNSVYLPQHVLDFKSRMGAVTTEELGWLPKDTTFGRREYAAPDGFKATLAVVLMGADRTSIHKPQICMPGQGWKIESTETVQIPVERPHPYSLPAKLMIGSRNVTASTGVRKQLIAIYIYWFVAKDKLTSEHWDRMWYMTEHMLRTGELQRWAYVSCASICEPGREPATINRMKQLIAATVPEFQLPAGGSKMATARAD
jgi:uncharacterized protein DUF3485